MGVSELKLEVYRICAGLARAPRNERLALLRQEIEKLPQDCREIAISLVTTTLASTEEQTLMQTWEKITMITAGATFLLILLAIALFVPQPTGFQIYIFRVVLALAAAAFVCALPGLLQVEGRVKAWLIRAGGSLGVFVLIYTINPPRILAGTMSAQL